jgi:hypothetical protein
MKCWCTIPSPSRIASAGAGCAPAAVHLDRARVRRDHAVQHAHQRGLARAVLADQRVDLARRESSETSSLAVTGPNALVMPRSDTAGTGMTRERNGMRRRV